MLAWRYLGSKIVSYLDTLVTGHVRWGVAWIKTFPRSVIAANKVASGSASDCKMPTTVPQDSF